MLLLQGKDEVDIQVPLEQFTVYKDWHKDRVHRSTTFCKYGAIDMWPDGPQESIAGQILVIQPKGVKLAITDTHVTLTIMRY